jgi:hypothetical protein
MNDIVEFRPGHIVGRHDERPVPILDVLASDGLESCRAILDLMDAALRLELPDRCVHVPAGELRHDGFERGILLPNDHVQPDHVDAGLLQLLVRSTGFHGLVLPDITHQEHTIVRAEPAENEWICTVLVRLASSTT